MHFKTLVLATVVNLVIASSAMAHSDVLLSNGEGFWSGVSHPWFGADHLLAMVAVGLLSARMGGLALWVLPSSFLGFLAIGGVLGMTNFNLQMVELGIALSVVTLGAALAVGRKYPIVFASVAIGGMGLFHGHAHGTEMPSMTTPAFYAIGFIATTAVIHLLGILAGLWLVRSERRISVLRSTGALLSLAGITLLVSAL
jgi:urease accessory protein